MDKIANYTDAARRILREVPLIDGHNDWPWNIREWFESHLGQPDIDLDSIPIGQTDLHRLEQGLLGAQFWSAYVPCPKSPEEHDPALESLQIIRTTLQQIDLIHRIVERYPTRFGFAETATEVWNVFRSGRIACLIGVEGLHQIGNSFSVLRMYRRLGVRYVTLTHTKNNLFADASTADPTHNGLSERGRAAVQEMNRVGLMVDLSHTSKAVQLQALETSVAPVIFSHSSCHALTAHVRNVDDEVLDLVKINGGVVMVCFLEAHVTKEGNERATLADVVDHIMYMGKRIGYAHVGVGSDFDGMLRGPLRLDQVTDYPALVERLLGLGVTDDEVKQVLGLNILRVMDHVDAVAASLQRNPSIRPALDDITTRWTDDIRDMLVKEGKRRLQDKTEATNGI
ncbi:GliJ [[Torrubiella] hemipterigena]|uniref:Dipeptidase n=1 Tax=[Torrubiella] hemipterigena TaxID=1531966 RepID=A0A0A1TAC4_9HYPO|nr:GliJ [[Torrubiella] hemipterigena]